MPSLSELARVTITAAFQRMNARMRRSMNSSPGNHGSWAGGMVLMYGVETVAGKPTCSSRARSSSFIRRKRPRPRPWASTTASKESSHSPVTSGSMSGSWWLNPSKITVSRLGLVRGFGSQSLQEVVVPAPFALEVADELVLPDGGLAQLGRDCPLLEEGGDDLGEVLEGGDLIVGQQARPVVE